MGKWKIITPSAADNYVKNPIAMGGSGFTAVGAATITEVTGYSYLGYQCYRLQTNGNNTGAYWDLQTTPTGDHYFTFRVYTTAYDVPTLLDCSMDNVNFTAPTFLYHEAPWYVFGVAFPSAQASAKTTVRILQNGSTAVDIYIGHLQIELGTVPTTPITGDLQGFTENGYYWNGEAHLSFSSRRANERSGGLLVDLEDDCNFRVLYGVGTGMPPIRHFTSSASMYDGATFQGSKNLPRILDLYSGTLGDNSSEVAAARRDVINLIKSDLVDPEQPIVVRTTVFSETKPVDFYGVYDSGLEMRLTSGIVDKPDIRLICYDDPYVYEVHTQGSALGTLNNVFDADYIVRRINGTWENISTEFNLDVWSIARGSNGHIFIGGSFTDVGSVYGDYIVEWDPVTETLSPLDNGTTGPFTLALCATPGGDVYATGQFSSAGGTTMNNVGRWNIAAADWYALTGGSGTGLNNQGFCLAYGHNGKLYIGGVFTLAGGIANTAYICYWDPDATEFYPLGTGMNGSVYSIAIAPNGDVIATGSFTTAGGVSCAGIAKWDGSTWAPLGAGLTGGTATGYGVVFDRAGNLFVTGSFTAADGVSCSNIAKWNGKTFEPLGSGLNAYGRGLITNNKGLIYVYGNFTAAGTLDIIDRIAIWNGYTWAHLDINLPGSPLVYTMLAVDDDLYIGYNSSGTAYSSVNNSINNLGSMSTWPIIKIYRPISGTYAKVIYLKNNDTGAVIWLNYDLVKGETLTIDLAGQQKRITSDYFGSVWQAVLRGSNLANFKLLPGLNNISLMVSADHVTYGWAEWKISHWSADMVA